MLRINFTVNIEIGKKSSHQLTKTSWNRLRMLVKKRDNATCHYCNEEAEDGEPDHIMPLSRGGTDSMDNLIWACKSCNRSKGSKTPDEWQPQTIDIEESSLVTWFLDSSRLPETIIDLGSGKTIIKDGSGKWVEISDEAYQALRSQYAVPITELNIPITYPMNGIPDVPPISHRQIAEEEVIDL